MVWWWRVSCGDCGFVSHRSIYSHLKFGRVSNFREQADTEAIKLFGEKHTNGAA